MKIAGRKPIGRVMMGPHLACKFRRIISSSEKDLSSHSRFPTIGNVVGPGGSFSFRKMKL